MLAGIFMLKGIPLEPCGGVMVWLALQASDFGWTVCSCRASQPMVSLYLASNTRMPRKSICSVDQTFDCDINGSAYAELFGIPIASWATASAGVAMLSILCLRSRLRTSTRHTPVAGSGCRFYLFLAYVSIGIGAWCLFISMYGLNGIILWQSWGLTRAATGVSGALGGGRSTNAFAGAGGHAARDDGLVQCWCRRVAQGNR